MHLTMDNVPQALSFAVIMEAADARLAFYNYLHKDNSDSLLEFWEGVEKLKSTPKVEKYKKGSCQISSVFLE